ncbi:MAG: hypothetical protein GEV03_25655 [Streptosporangiales bacterium]|nr:hypothetical protein [Streptosporangiales bacterium]
MAGKDKGATSAPPKDVDGYLATVAEDARAALQDLRATIKAAVPEAVEVISYQVPTYKYRGRPVVSFGAAQNTSKGTIRFPANEPLPAALVRKLVEARIAENEAGR